MRHRRAIRVGLSDRMRSEEIVDGIVKNVKAGRPMDRSTVFFKKDKKGKVSITERKEEASENTG